MTDQKDTFQGETFRIKNSRNECATITRTGEFTYNIFWDDNQFPGYNIAKHIIDDALKSEWLEIEMKLPDTFKFTVKNDTKVYTAAPHSSRNDLIHIVRDEDTVGTYYSKQSVENFVKTGDWVIIEEPAKGCADVPYDAYTTKLHDNEEVVQNSILESIRNKLTDGDILKRIKDFTSSSEHFVAIEHGQYQVYREGEDIPYTTESEECLLEVMKAIEVLDAYGN